MDIALPYVLVNISALFVVGFIASRMSSKSAVKRRQSADHRRHQIDEVQASIHEVKQDLEQVNEKQSSQQIEFLRTLREPNHRSVQTGPTESEKHTIPSVEAISGSGVMLVVIKKGKMCMILFRQARSGTATDNTFSDAGGGCHNEGPAPCASRELEEESIGTFRLDLSKVPHYPAQYVAYLGQFIAVRCTPPDPEKVYVQNLKLISTLHSISPEWKETVEMGYFAVDDLLTIAESKRDTHHHRYKIKTVYGLDAFVSDRVVGLVKVGLSTGVFKKLEVNMKNASLVHLKKHVCADGVGRRGSRVRLDTRRKTYCYST